MYVISCFFGVLFRFQNIANSFNLKGIQNFLVLLIQKNGIKIRWK